ncbi:MAG: fibrobacter succinogenes major paralogous domain-containing protein, partial [Saprospiraceae bacterium]|nr:fibrobacter succinogenes major paralogous domain-containing protein [Saprospiraceae bacterium]
ATGLPSGVTAAWSANVITISGTPTAAGTFNYTIPLTGGCGTMSATGTITVNPAPVCPSATITYNSYTYNTVAIGTQCWMAENLRTRKYNDGTDIPFDASGGVGGRDVGETWSAFTYGAHTIYEHDSTPTTGNLAIYGYLYNWYAAKGIATPGSIIYKNICPDGWHIPTNTQWRTLKNYLSPNDGDKLKSTENYWTPNTGNDNTSSFAARPGGVRFSSNGQFFRKNTAAHFWSSILLSTVFTGQSGAFTYTLFTNDSGLAENNWPDFTTGASIRCLKD